MYFKQFIFLLMIPILEQTITSQRCSKEAAAAETTCNSCECLDFTQPPEMVGYVGHKRQNQYKSCAQGTELSDTVAGQRPA